MKIAYVLNTYPQPSQSFIRREIHALERSGVGILRLAMRRFEGPLVDPRNEGERQRTHYVLEQGVARLLWAVLRRMVKAPGAFLTALGLTVRMIRTAGADPIRHLFYLIEAAYVAERCAAEGVEHLHAHFATNSAAVAMLAATLSGLPFSFTMHGPEEFDAPEALSLPLKLARADLSVAVSQFGRSQLYRWAGFEHWPKIRVVQCGIEPSVFPEPTPLPEGPLRLVTIGRFVEQKGQMTLVLAMARLRDSHPDIRLTLVGDGQMRPDLEAAIRRHGLEDRIALTGWVDEARVNAELASAHALVMPSFAEGLPMVLMEAMATGRPVISTYIAGIPELVTPEIGLLVPAGDVEALAAALVGMAGMARERMLAMGLAGRARVLERHDVDREAAKLLGHIRALKGRG
ncbi:glycosyltransferase family 4 protein [Oceaniglobus roseus]|uniref:glycosyltransferase family 4 protein n=1 Tax=Oceaniglobus roseus TaxID=1737570 RepID=UPI000C7EE9C8|nr:glycosyltransferase family 4 protein [Kandeliimicrobium roseum]